MKNRKLRMTIVAPVGRSAANERNTPRMTDRTPLPEATMIVILKPLATWRAVTGGSMRSDDMSIIPTTRIARTTVSDVRRTRIALMVFVLTPLALADSSSKVIERSSWKKNQMTKIRMMERRIDETTSVLLMAKILPKR